MTTAFNAPASTRNKAFYSVLLLNGPAHLAEILTTPSTYPSYKVALPHHPSAQITPLLYPRFIDSHNGTSANATTLHDGNLSARHVTHVTKCHSCNPTG